MLVPTNIHLDGGEQVAVERYPAEGDRGAFSVISIRDGGGRSAAIFLSASDDAVERVAAALREALTPAVEEAA